MSNCCVCSVVNSSYKCPICRIPYCSVKCFKTHKEQKCTPPPNLPEENKPKYEFVTDETVPEEKLKNLDNNEELLLILKNKHVQDILRDIDSSEDPEEMMEQAMKEPIFVEFADTCLKLIGETPPETD